MPRIKKVKVVRGSGRPSFVEKGIVDALLFNANMLRQWQIDTDRVATGRSASSYKVIVERPKNRVSKSLGIVSGKITALKHTKFALEGRKAGKAPPIHEIEQWLVAKKLKSKTHTRAQLARMISRSIGRQGTLPPHFTEAIQTKLTRLSAEKAIRAIKKPLAASMGRKYVRNILKAAKHFDNFSYSSRTVTLTNEELDNLINPI